MNSPEPHKNHPEDAHTGPVKTPMQFLQLAAFSFIVPIFIIIGLVYYVVSASKPTGSAAATQKGETNLTGLSDEERSKAILMRIQKVGSVEVRDANRALKSGEEVYKAQCINCHGAGLAGSPKFGDTSAWASRIKSGYPALWSSALKGKGTMGAQGGGDWDDLEVGRAVVYMANEGGANFPEPQRNTEITAS